MNNNKIWIKIIWFEKSVDYFNTINYIINNYNINFYPITDISKEELEKRISYFEDGIKYENKWSKFLADQEYEYKQRISINIKELEILIDSLSPYSPNISLALSNLGTRQVDRKYFYFINFKDLLSWKKELPFNY